VHTIPKLRNRSVLDLSAASGIEPSVYADLTEPSQADSVKCFLSDNPAAAHLPMGHRIHPSVELYRRQFHLVGWCFTQNSAYPKLRYARCAIVRVYHAVQGRIGCSANKQLGGEVAMHRRTGGSHIAAPSIILDVAFLSGKRDSYQRLRAPHAFGVR
jgi:hypothetical protein